MSAANFVNIACPEMKATIEKLKLFVDQSPLAVQRGLRSWAEEVATESKVNRVPVDLGPLRASLHAKTVLAGAISTADIGAGGPAGAGNLGGTNSEEVGYALTVHENPRAGKTGGVSPSGKPYKHWAKTGEWKYLENPIREALPLLGQTIGAELNKELAKVRT